MRKVHRNFANLRNHILIFFFFFPVLIFPLHINVWYLVSGLNVKGWNSLNLLSPRSLNPVKVRIFFLIYRLQQKQRGDYSSKFRRFSFKVTISQFLWKLIIESGLFCSDTSVLTDLTNLNLLHCYRSLENSSLVTGRTDLSCSDVVDVNLFIC